ncbi:MAG: transposase family protein [Clostridia bacterium]|nr:transposase family protein [Clostridia bacterium]
MNRKEKREMKKEIEVFSDVVKIIKQYFPSLIEKLEQLTDVRHQSYVEYSMSVITITRLLGLICGLRSMRQMTESFNTNETIENISKLLGVELEELPHHDTINKVLENIDIRELQKIQKYMVQKLIRSKMFDKYRYKGKYFQVVIDGTGLARSNQRHCNNCLKRTYNKGQEDEYSIYYHYVLEAKLVVGDIVISIDTEFIENEGFNMQKNGTFDIEHVYSNNYNAMKAHYLFIQFAHTIRQLLEKGLKYIKDMKMSIKGVSVAILQTLTHKILNLTGHNKIQLRFDLK